MTTLLSSGGNRDKTGSGALAFQSCHLFSLAVIFGLLIIKGYVDSFACALKLMII